MDKKFDIILSNPPWGQNIHYEFTQKYLDIADTVISIMPNSIVKRDTKHFKKYKEAYNDYLYDVEELDSKNFEDTNMQNCCIFCFSQDKEDLHIKYIDGKTETISGILEKDYSGFTDYEKDIVKYLYNEHPNIIEGAHGLNGKSIKKDLPGYINKILSKLPDNKSYLICNAANGNSSGNCAHRYFSSKIGQIFDNKEDLRVFLINRGGVKNHYLYFNSIKAAINCKSAMERPLLRFPLARTQSNQSLSIYHYQYIPDIDWSNIESDYDILKACNCPENKIEEYIQYVTDIINKEETISGILEKDYSGFTDYEKDIVKYLYNEHPNIIEGAHGLNGKSIKKDLVGFANKLISKLPDNKAYLICNATDGNPAGNCGHRYFTSVIGQIFNTKEELKKWLYERNGKVCHYMYFNSIKAAINCKSAMERPLLRFPLVRTQSDQHLTPSKHYKYIPDIDWEDERVKTDEGLLEVCGCPKDKCKEYADYCRKVIEEKDRK